MPSLRQDHVGWAIPCSAERVTALHGCLSIYHNNTRRLQTWLSVALGMVTKSVEAASNLPLPLILLPFFDSGFVPTSSMPDGVRRFGENQPFTPLIETLRGLLMGTPMGDSGLLTIAWCIACIAISLGSYLWAPHTLQSQLGTLAEVAEPPDHASDF